MNAVLQKIAALLKLEATALEWLESPLLLLIRLNWGYALMLNGWGKLHHLDDIAQWFGEGTVDQPGLHIPMPYANACMAASTEFLGGMLLIFGLGSRITTIPVIITMCVAYATADRAALESFWLNADQCDASPTCVEFTAAAPFEFLFAYVLVLVFGPGAFSADELIKRWWNANNPAPKPKKA